MARRSISIDEKIEHQKEVVSRAKGKYEAELSVLDKYMQKRDEVRKKEILNAITSSGRSYEEIMEFLEEKPLDE